MGIVFSRRKVVINLQSVLIKKHFNEIFEYKRVLICSTQFQVDTEGLCQIFLRMIGKIIIINLTRYLIEDYL